MQRTIADTTLALARRAGPTMRLAGDPHAG
jgi:hypothetical protein